MSLTTSTKRPKHVSAMSSIGTGSVLPSQTHSGTEESTASARASTASTSTPSPCIDPIVSRLLDQSHSPRQPAQRMLGELAVLREGRAEGRAADAEGDQLGEPEVSLG